jgi:hypothetical protein
LGCVTPRIPHFLDSPLADGDEVVSLTRRPRFIHGRSPGTHFCYRMRQPQGRSAAGSNRSIEKFNALFGNSTCDLPGCSIVPQATTLPRTPGRRIDAYFILTEQSEVLLYLILKGSDLGV